MGKRRGRRGGKRRGGSKRSKSIRNKVRGLRGGRKNRSRNAARRAQARARANARRGRNNGGRGSSRNNSPKNTSSVFSSVGGTTKGGPTRNGRGGNGGGKNNSGGGSNNFGDRAKEIQAAKEAKKEKRKERRKAIRARVLERKKKRDAKKLGTTTTTTTTTNVVDNTNTDDNKLATGTGISRGLTYMDPKRWGDEKLATSEKRGQFDKDGNYNFGKRFNENDIRIMTEAGKSINDIKDYMKQNDVKSKGRYETMFSRINAGKGFDKKGENFDYGYRFDNRDINKMFKAGKDRKYISDFISNNEGLDDNKIAQRWMKRYGDVGEVDDDETGITDWQQQLLDRIDGLEKRLNEGGGGEETVEPTETPKAQDTNWGGFETGVMSPWANTGPQSVFNPMAMYYQMSGITPGSAAGGTPQGTALTETVNQQPKVQAPVGANAPQPVQQPTYQAQNYQPMTYQPIGVPGTSQAFNYTNPPSSGYNPSGSGSPLVAPLNAFTQTPQPVGQNGLPVYPTMTYGPGTGPIPGQVTPQGTTPGYAFPQAPGMPGTPSTPSGQVYAGGNPSFDPKTGKYKGPAKPNPKAPQAVAPQFAPLNQLGL